MTGELIKLVLLMRILTSPPHFSLICFTISVHSCRLALKSIASTTVTNQRLPPSITSAVQIPVRYALNINQKLVKGHEVNRLFVVVDFFDTLQIRK